ncbi:MAG: aldehyde dehydrogenase family protein [Hyphomonadaceae bacterium]
MSRTIKVRNPRTGENDYSFDAPDDGEIAARAEKLRAAQCAWSENGIAYRVDAMLRWAAAVEAAQDRIAEALFADTGRLTISRSRRTGAGAKCIVGAKRHRGCWRHPKAFQSWAPSVAFKPQYVPYPLVGVISPWNFPLTLALIDALPALMAGCAVMVKPSEITPRFIRPLRRRSKPCRNWRPVRHG